MVSLKIEKRRDEPVTTSLFNLELTINRLKPIAVSLAAVVTFNIFAL